ncbi:MAG: type I DNA topoisomerase [Erysipelotrichales bacterium]|nr:type I DNA topoisomerase [Erysipelotrichales bacterium]
MKLVIVESPAKTHTISAYLGDEYKVVSSKGHIRDLSTTGKYGLGVDVENNFEPNYIPIAGKKKDIASLKKDVKESDFIYLATDPDREGEAISWHLYDALDIDDSKYERVVFNEITKPAVKEAFNNARKIDYNLVKSQETRRILDRIIGFRLSKLMQSKTGGKSAGRVQSVALKLIVDREREIEAFIPEEYWTITAKFKDFESTLEKYKSDKIEVHSEEEANIIVDALSNEYKIESIEQKEKNRSGVMPFTTSTLQQACINKFNYNSTKVMSVAQKLYEGINLGNETVGLITYMRTDSTRLSPIFINETFKYIEDTYGKNYVGAVKKGKKNDNIQDAHEAIRPTSITRTPESVKKYLSSDEYKIYSIIYARALASLMKDAKVLATTVILDNNEYKFKSTGQILIFDGFLAAYKDYSVSNDVILPDFKEFNGVVSTTDVLKEQKFTKPSSRYTEATLIEEMEKLGIGRPSTYATTMKTLKDRDYVKVEEKKFHPTEMGIETTDKLQEFFSNIINVEYTATMETDLDKIADDDLDNIKVLKDFYKEFEPLVQTAFKDMEKKAPKLTGETCPECGSELVIRKGRFGEFTACSNYPTCKYIKKEEKVIVTICKCSKCSGDIVEKTTRKGKTFYGCNNYPKCDLAVWDKPTGDVCPECSSLLVEKKDEIKCSSCEYTK